MDRIDVSRVRNVIAAWIVCIAIASCGVAGDLAW